MGAAIGLVTVITDALLFTLPLEAVTLAVPAATAVTRPLELTVATDVLLEAHESVAAIELPLWLRGVAMSCCVLPTTRDADGVTVMVVSIGVGLVAVAA